MITYDQDRLAIPDDERRQFPCNAAAQDQSVDHGSQTFLRDIVDHVKDPEPVAVGEVVVDEIDRPARVRRGYPQERSSCPSLSSGPVACAPTGLLAIEPLGLLAIYDIASPSQQNMQLKVTGPASLGRHRPQALAPIVVVGAATGVSN